MSTVIETAIPAGTWKIDKAHTKVGFAVKHMGVSTVRGDFREFDGTLEAGEDGTLRAYGTVQAESVHTGQEQRDEHLRSADFFDVERYPEITFESASLERVGGEDFKIIGDLTIHGVTKPIELSAELGGVELGMEGEHRAGLEVTGRLSRGEYGMRFSAALGSGNAVVADKVKLALDVEAVRQDALDRR